MEIEIIVIIKNCNIRVLIYFTTFFTVTLLQLYSLKMIRHTLKQSIDVEF